MMLVWRRFLWRLGRKIYQVARRESPNLMETNGELWLQRRAVDALPASQHLIVFDVGARVGDWSRSLMGLAARRAGGCDIHAFEPVPESRAQLEKLADLTTAQMTLRINGFALSDEFGRFPIYVPHPMAGTSTLYPDSRVSYERVLEVEIRTIDAYCRENNIDHIDFMKIDTEGNDSKVIRGATELLKKGRIGIIQFEYSFLWINSRTYLKDVFDMLGDTPYVVGKVCATGLEVYREWHPELERYFETNYALVHTSLVNALGCRLVRIGDSNAVELVQKIDPPGQASAFPAHG
jgi:FkbM family methyltransferase